MRDGRFILSRTLIHGIGWHTAMILVLLTAPLAAAQGQGDVVRGNVTSDSGTALPGADVFVTMAPSADVIRDKSDSLGNFSISIPSGTGEYLVYIGALGHSPFRRRLTRTSTVDTTFTINARLSRAVTSIAAVHVQARKPRPTRSLASQPGGTGTDGMERTVDGVSGAFPPDLRGNLEAMAATVPGLTVTPSGVSALGAGTQSSNLTTLNGLAFAGADIPRDARTTTRFSTSPWDPTIGGFSGFLSSTTLARGDNISRRVGHISLDAPALQLADPHEPQYGQEFSAISLSEGGTGPLILDKLFYNFGLTTSRRVANASAFTNLSSHGLNGLGIAADSASRLLAILGSLHIPATSSSGQTRRTTTTGSAIGQIDHISRTPTNGAVPGPVWSLTGYGQYATTQAPTLGPLMLPSYAGKSEVASLALQGVYSAYFGSKGSYVNETTSGLSVSDSRESPYVALPGGSVLVSSDLSDGTQGIAQIQFGGNSFLATHTRTLNWELVNQTNFLAGGRSAFPLKLYVQSRFTQFDQSAAANRLGSFDFPSLSALSSGAPSRFSRSLNPPSLSGGEWVGAAALGGNWLKGNITVTGGARVDANLFTVAPPENARVGEMFGVHTSHAPNAIAVSPRIGFTWRYTGARGYSSSGTPVSVINRGGAQIRGGIGEFRSLLPSTLLADALRSTGLAGAERQVVCIGSAVPVPNWESYQTDPSTVPADCLEANTFASTTPSITLFDRSYTPSRSWRATLGWTSTVKNVYLAVDGTYALNLDLPSTIDLNFAGHPFFLLKEEANRPVYTPQTDIVPTTGAVSPSAARSFTTIGSVNDRISDERGDARQVTVYAIPSLPLRVGLVTLGYTYSDVHSQARGFDQNTAGDPRPKEWGPSEWSPTHQFVAQGAHVFGKIGITTFLRVASGLRFTPLVAADINGDGLANDRAFIFDGAGASGTQAAPALQSVLTSSSSRMRECLQRQIGRVAARNSCEGPWSATMNASMFLFPALPATGGRAKVALSFTNVLAGLDQLTHGSNHVHGWGGNSIPDPILYQVRGFDPDEARFLYAVNPRFGAPSVTSAGLRTPFRVSLDISIDIGPSPERQELVQSLRLRPGLVGTRAPADSIKKRYMAANFTNVYGVLLQMSDSLALSGNQIKAVQQQYDVLQRHADSIYTALSVTLSELPDQYDQQQALKQVSDGNAAVWEAIYGEKIFLLQLLTPGQLRLLPSPLFQMLTVPHFKQRFFFG